MGKNRKQKNETKKSRRRQNVRLLVLITSLLIVLLFGWLWHESTQENTDLSNIGQGKNVVVQIHDPG